MSTIIDPKDLRYSWKEGLTTLEWDDPTGRVFAVMYASKGPLHDDDLEELRPMLAAQMAADYDAAVVDRDRNADESLQKEG